MNPTLRYIRFGFKKNLTNERDDYMGNLDTGFAAGTDVEGRKLGFFSLKDSQTFESEVSVAEALELAGMNFTVAKKPIYRMDNGGNYVEVPGKFETYRTDLDRNLGVVGNQYTPFNNAEALSMVDELLGFGAQIRSAGTWNGGADVFITAQLPNGIHVPEVDVDLYLMFRNNHSGTGSVSCYITPVDLRCTNQISAAVHKAATAWKCRHTRSVGDKIQEATTALRLVDEYREAMAATIRQLQETEMGIKEFEDFAEELVPTSENHQNRVKAQLIEVYNTSENLTRGNRWGAYSAVTETLDWHPGRSSAPESRFASQMDGPIARSRDRAMRLLTRR